MELSNTCFTFELINYYFKYKIKFIRIQISTAFYGFLNMHVYLIMIRSY